MSDERIIETRTESPAWTLPAVIVLGLIAIGGLAFGWNASSKLDATREDLKRARSEMGTLIARNHDEIDQLRRLGERDYVEFTITGKNKPAKVSNVTVELKGVNEKRNQVSIAMTVEDKRFEKKNRALNDPIFFYLSGTHIPEEIVINKVGKNTIRGYVSIPKANSP